MYLRTHFSQMPKKRANYANYAGCVGVTVSLTPVYISTYSRFCIRACTSQCKHTRVHEVIIVCLRVTSPHLTVLSFFSEIAWETAAYPRLCGCLGSIG